MNRTAPDTSKRAPSEAEDAPDIDGHDAGSHPAGAAGNDPGITWACASISTATYRPGTMATCTASCPGTSPASVSMARPTSDSPKVWVCIRASGNRPVSISRIASA